MHKKLSYLLNWIRSTTRTANGLVIPVSGGSDSALCFWLCSRAFPERTVGIHFGKQLRAQDWFQNCGQIQFLDEPTGTNQKKEVQRWAAALEFSLYKKYWLVGTRNRTEQIPGTYSLASRVASFLPIIGLWKTEVLHLCSEISVPQSVTDSSLLADPECGRSPELANISPDVIDLFVKAKSGKLSQEEFSAFEKVQTVYIEFLEKIYIRNQFKALLPTKGPDLSCDF